MARSWRTFFAGQHFAGKSNPWHCTRSSVAFSRMPCPRTNGKSRPLSSDVAMATGGAAGDASARVNLGFAYEHGNGVARDEAEAVKWYRKAADAGRTQWNVQPRPDVQGGPGGAQDEAQAVVGIAWQPMRAAPRP